MCAGSGVIDVDETKEPAATEVGVVSGELLPLSKNDSDEFPVCPHPFLLVEADESWGGGVDCVIPAHLCLWKSRGGYGE